MLGFLFKKVFGTANERYVKTLNPIVEKTNALENAVKAMPDEAFPARILELKEEAAKGKSLESLMPEVFALVREASVRTLGMRHFDVQLIGGAVLHAGKIA